MRSKSNDPTSASAYKPFMTEYRLSFKDPTPASQKGHQTTKAVVKTGKSAGTNAKSFRRTATISGGAEAYHQNHGQPSNLPNIATQEKDVYMYAAVQSRKKDIWQPPPMNGRSLNTSLTLPGMLDHLPQTGEHYPRRRIVSGVPQSGGQSLRHRYNIITGHPTGEPYSGYKEGRRAVIESFAHIDAVTNARTPGYNIVTGHDPTKGLDTDQANLLAMLANGPGF
ncbi:uncharacterized protein BJ171DRAFT_595697 [Polychytrium aggregatum]|uniref:uncharacterized protein n=1 Tax=Polychytrium aggregatum TaxID=110093 RepID=UPI0022FE252D|nr:uncharacterized protein BJ171DRAFT_595697 [Polychytrium aggregatum]KAI9208562.1 hypothetical protein BJ171DRAFT_595697 [Polychytrium aggregatum]